ncbi:flagellar motor protein MotB [Candidatus Formimonas warabiya]|uniref:Chemotaxis protein MotB n=1 Tax=Formimonas warabiya TaxID=1761012 RepID=A0A3G1KX47_FORW1|nr:flagellar motor protein MotB [Candidatus Formimonas warabiya]ATW26967.1 chemotaxis protein MotB [Candidatus Formimonas warabiya]
MRRPEEHEKDNTERWLLSYADFITLLMIFFVILYSMSRIDAAKFEMLAQTLGKTLTGTQYILKGSSGPSMVSGISAGETFPSTQVTPNSLYVNRTPTYGTNDSVDQNAFKEVEKILDNFIKENGLEGVVSHYVSERGLVVSLSNAALFDSGSSELHADQKKTVIKIGEILKVLPNLIRVEGHTDNRPIHNARFPSNWELSVLRATTVLQILVADVGISPDKISAIGYGEYRPIAPNDSGPNRQLNRRVDIVIMKSEYNQWEPNQTKTP